MDAVVSLTTGVDRLPGVSPAQVRALVRLGLTNIGKLVAHLPHRHEWLHAEAAMDQLEAGHVVTTRGEITATRIAGFGRRQRFEAVLCDETGRVELVFFNQAYLRNKLHPGARLRVQGKGRRQDGALQLANPKYWLLDDDEPDRLGARLRPVYPATEDLDSEAIERILRSVLDTALEQIEDHLGESYRAERGMPSLADAYRWMHVPEDEAQAEAARRRLAYDELLMLQLGVAIKRRHLREKLRAPALREDEEVGAHIRARLPFELTPAQDRVVREVSADLGTAVPMNRLVQGDVGSGKTVVAVYAMLMAVASGHQAALMAPTELLAEQHHESISALLDGSKVRVGLLTGTTPEPDRELLLHRLESGDLDLLIGTHALLTDRVRYRSLAVVIIDEQHRFGVHQRATLRTRAGDDTTTPHVLVMTATPIPRTLTVSLLGDLDVSTIDGLPPGRQPVTTTVVGTDARDGVYTRLRQRLESGEQGYVVVPAIDTGATRGDSELKDLRSVHKELEAGPLAGRSLAALHGRLKRATRERVMQRFRGGMIEALVATTVIEVGVDVPNATMMVVEHADRFGLAQLHQLRGRVGRGSARAECVLIADPATDDGAARLSIMASTSDGFELAERDFELRGPGEMFGTRQSGSLPLRVADLIRDRELLLMARRDARGWIGISPTLNRAEEALLKRRMLRMFGAHLGLVDVA